MKAVEMKVNIGKKLVSLTPFVLLILLNLTFPLSFASVLDNELANDPRFQQGKEKYEAMKKETKMPKYSKCWTDALSKLDIGCKHLTDDVQHRLALAFTNCHLEKTGRVVYPCDGETDIATCTKYMSTEAYIAFTEFFTHTQNICFFLQAQVWHDSTQIVITRLADNSAVVAQQIEDSSQLQSELLKRQNDSLHNQELLIKGGHELKKSLEDSSVDVQRLLSEFKDSTSEQRTLIFEVFDKVSALQSVVMGEFTGFYSLIFYTASVLVSYLLTSTPRTSGARFKLFVLMTVNAVVERLIVVWGAQDNTLSEGHILDSSTVIYGRLWLCRKLFSTLAVFTWIYSAYRYRDLNQINNSLLCDIKKQNSELKVLLETSQVLVTPSAIRSMPRRHDMSLNHGPLGRITDFSQVEEYGDQVDTTVNTTTGYESDFESDTSSESGDSDHTYCCEDSDNDSIMTTSSGRYSREGTPSLLDELRDLRQATPLREMSPMKNSLPYANTSDNSHLSPDNFSTSIKKQPGRPKKNERSKPQVRHFPAYQQTYYLRHRRVPTNNPVVESESAKDFAKTVKHFAKIAMRNSVKTHYTIERKQEGFFSSDDE